MKHSVKDVPVKKVHASRSALAVAVAGLMVVALAGCSPAAEPTESAAALTPVRIIVAPIQYETAYIADEQGFFEEAGLDVEILTGADGAANAARVLGGDAELTISSWTAMVTSTAAGLPLKVVMGNGVISGEEDTSGILVRADSDIQSIADLAGRQVAVQSPGTGTDIPLLVAAQEAGIDPASISLANIPYAGMAPALEQGQVDAAFGSSQFYSQMIADGNRVIANPAREYFANQPSTLWASSTSWLEENPDAASAFVSAMTKAVDFYTANPEVVREITSRVAQIPIDQVSETIVPMDAEINLDPAAEMIGYLEQFGVVENPLTIDEILWADAPRN